MVRIIENDDIPRVMAMVVASDVANGAEIATTLDYWTQHQYPPLGVEGRDRFIGALVADPRPTTGALVFRPGSDVRTLRLIWLGVDGESRGSGIATGLLDAIEYGAGEMGFTSVVADVPVDRRSVIDLLHRRGWDGYGGGIRRAGDERPIGMWKRVRGDALANTRRGA